MCDRPTCGVIFSENEEGWSTAVNTVQKRRENGTRYGEQQQMDLCPTCATGVAAVPRLPQHSLGAGATAAEQAEQAEAADDHVMLRGLQREIAELREQLGDRAPVVAGHVEPPATVSYAGPLSGGQERILWQRCSYSSGPRWTCSTSPS